MIPPEKPFPEYKWRWASFEVTEGLNAPPVFLGTLRAFARHEGAAPSDAGLIADLAAVQKETGTKVDLARTEDRNLIRNSGQYWKAFGLLEDTRGEVQLTPFGRRLAEGKITKDEFAATAIKTLTLPNAFLERDTSDWDKARLRIRPLQLLLAILSELRDRLGADKAYLTVEELVRIVIPLAGTKAPIDEYIAAIAGYRAAKLDISGWPNCAPSDNDPRMAHEFLLFLWYYGICNQTPGKTRLESRYSLPSPDISALKELSTAEIKTTDPSKALDEVRATNTAAAVERQRILVEVAGRPNQAKFRREVLNACECCCIVTGERLIDVLEASHIVPVENDGSDEVDNGLCLRADIHRLFDAGHIRIAPDGAVVLSEVAATSPTYRILPRKIGVPAHVSASLEWRWKYY